MKFAPILLISTVLAHYDSKFSSWKGFKNKYKVGNICNNNVCKSPEQCVETSESSYMCCNYNYYNFLLDYEVDCRDGMEHPCVSEKHACTDDQFCQPVLMANAPKENSYKCVDSLECDDSHVKCEKIQRAGCLNSVPNYSQLLTFMNENTIMVNNLPECYYYCLRNPECVSFEIQSHGKCILSNKSCATYGITNHYNGSPIPDVNNKVDKGIPSESFYYEMEFCHPPSICKNEDSKESLHPTTIVTIVICALLGLVVISLIIDIICYFNCQAGLIFRIRHGRRVIPDDVGMSTLSNNASMSPPLYDDVATLDRSQTTSTPQIQAATPVTQATLPPYSAGPHNFQKNFQQYQ